MRRSMLSVLMALALAAASCTTAAQYRGQALASQDPEERVGYLWEYEVTDPSDRAVSEDDIASDIDLSIKRWPEDWRFHAFKASHFVRAGDMRSAQVEHEEAKRLYDMNPYLIDPVLSGGAGVAIGVVGGLMGPIGIG